MTPAAAVSTASLAFTPLPVPAGTTGAAVSPATP